jgi:hypothetical protein
MPQLFFVSVWRYGEIENLPDAEAVLGAGE